ncbi:MAG: oligosaccharide flippase family protein [Candidatus Aenigmarchaeota archaeon]|nr:oligosaccharide flippase family protein [Candidatus Aenigmarchaeota archaeon]
MLRDITKGSVYLLVSVVIIKVLSVVYMPIVARILGPGDFGLLNLAIAPLPIFVGFSVFSIDSVITKQVSEYKIKGRSIDVLILNAFAIVSVFGLASAGLLYMLSDTIATGIFNNPVLGGHIRLTSLFVLVSSLYFVLLGILRGLKMFKGYAVTETLKQVAVVATGLVLVALLGFGITGYLMSLILGSVLLLLYNAMRHRKQLSLIKARGLSLARPLLKMGATISVLAFLQNVFFSLDKFFLGSMAAPELVGFYSSAVIVSSAAVSLIIITRNTMFPFVSESYASGDGKVGKLTEDVARYSIIIVGLLMLPLMLFGSEVVLILFGPEYLPVLPLLRVVIFSSFFVVLFNIFNTVLVAVAEFRKPIIFTAAGAAAASAVYYFSIGAMSAQGAAYGFVAAYAMLSMAYIFSLRAKVSIRPVFLAKAIAIPLVFLAVASFFSENAILWRILVFAILAASYAGILLLSKIISKSELDFFLRKLMLKH